MDSPFHERFAVAVGADAARLRFINRVKNEIWDDLLFNDLHQSIRFDLSRYTVSRLGDRFNVHGDLENRLATTSTETCKQLRTRTAPSIAPVAIAAADPFGLKPIKVIIAPSI
ncbi:MAG: hypothetical protein ABW318_08305 [Vicinamibacterales bacterium]